LKANGIFYNIRHENLPQSFHRYVTLIVRKQPIEATPSLMAIFREDLSYVLCKAMVRVHVLQYLVLLDWLEFSMGQRFDK